MSKQKRTLSPEHMCTKLFTNLTTTLFTKPACVYLPRQSPGVKQLLAPAAILPNYIQNHYGIKNSRHFSKSEKLGEKNLTFVKLWHQQPFYQNYIPTIMKCHYREFENWRRNIDYFRETWKDYAQNCQQAM